MLNSISANPPLFDLTAGIERNTVVNRGLMESLGVDVPNSLMANNRDEMIERFVRGSIFLFASLIIPTIAMPLINKYVLFSKGLVKNKQEIDILRVSKKYLTKDAGLMSEGFTKTASELEQLPKFKDISEYYNNVLNRYPDKEKLRETLIKAHEKIYSLNFAVSSILSTSIPWFTNSFTEKRTGRSGYVGEFQMADKAYTNRMAESHEKTKKLKMAASFALALIPAIFVPKLISKAILKPSSQLNGLLKFIKNKAEHFDYTDSIYLSRASYFAIALLGDLPAYLLACRDRHELEYRTKSWLYLIGMFFGGDFVLNNVFGRLFDHKLGTTIMNRQGFENAGFLRKFLMPVNRLENLNKIASTSKLTKKVALGMYWSNFILVTSLIGFGMPYILNKSLRKNVKEDQGKVLKKKPPDMYQFIETMHSKR